MEEHVINSLEDLEKLLQKSRPTSGAHLGDILLEEGYLTPQQLERALDKQKTQQGRHLGEILVEMGLSNREQIRAALAHKLGIPFVKLGDFEIAPKVLSLVPPDIALQYHLLPLAERGKHLIVAMENPLDREALEVLRFNTNHSIDPVITSRSEIRMAVSKCYQQFSESEISDTLDNLELNPIQDEEEALYLMEQEAQKKPIVRLVNAIIMQGIMHGASDINIRPGKTEVKIYYRIDGQLHFSRSIGRSLLAPIVSRIKIIGHMNIAERRLPQDGHAHLVHEDNFIDLRISVMPTVNGESIVVRILDKQKGLKPLEQLDLGEREYNLLRKFSSSNHGIILVTGPTGSGKTTTLYSILNEVRKRDPHVMTVEDPVEYNMEGVEQIQISLATGYTFAEALRHILRHDPDVIMVGEIRDLETARIANKAALTGHLVLSTLHTNDAPSTISRLLDMGIEPYLLSSTLSGVIAQRLVRLNCPQCKTREKVDPEIRKLLGVGLRKVFYRGKGCAACDNTGYHGRAAVCEILEVTPEIGTLINSGASTQEIRELAARQGMTPLTQNALELARKGKTSLEEVFVTRLE